MLKPLFKYADFQGRARRAEYWQWFAMQVVAGFIFGILRPLAGSIIIAVQALFLLGILVPSIAVAVRRFHDTGRTGWWFLFAPAVLSVGMILYIPFAGEAFKDSINNFEGGGADQTKAMSVVMGMMWVLLAYLAAAFVTFIFHILPGTEGPNRFGADPKGGAGIDLSVFDAPEELAAEAAKPPHKPIFDFTSPEPAPAQSAPAPAPVTYQPTTPTRQAPVFGKRR